MSVFCSLPFNAMFLRQDGSITPCCVYNQTEMLTLDTYFDSNELTTVKNSFINGKFPIQCSQCENNERFSGSSFRMNNSLFDSEEDEIKKVGSNYRNIKDVSIVTSNVCNLKCLPCYSGSYIRMEELVKMKLIPISKSATLTELSISTIDKITKFENLEQLTFSGGEPFGDKITFQLIDKLIEVGLSKNIRIDLNTNLTLITEEKLLKLKNNFKQVFLKCSIDGYGKVNEYLRYPSEWQYIVRAITLIKKLECRYVITTAMTNLALMRYYELVKWVSGISETIVFDMFQSLVADVPELRPTNLPIEIKEMLLEKYVSLKQEFKTDRTETLIDSCISMCKTTNDYDMRKTIAYLKTHDAHRGTNFLDVWPELKKYE